MKNSNKLSNKRKAVRFIIVNIGLFLVAAGLHFFLVPNDLAAGGSSGLAIVISSFLPIFKVSTILFAINSILVIIGVLTIGKVFGAYTIYSTFALSFYLRILEDYFPVAGPITDDVFINLFYGILIQAIGMGFVLNEGASTGGTDIIGMIFKKYTNFSFGTGLLVSDGLITLGALLQYGPKIGMYSLLGVFMNSLIIDKILYGFDSKFSLTIYTNEIDEIKNFILIDLYRGCTIYTAEGGYSHENRKIIETVVSRKDYIKLKSHINKVDPSAFVFVSQVNEVSGRGFTID